MSNNVHEGKYRPHVSLKSRIVKDDIKYLLKKAYLEGYRKRAIQTGQEYTNVDEVTGNSEFENWFENL